MELINHFLPSYGYLAVFLFVALDTLGSPLPGESAVIAAALYAGSTHRLNIGLIALVAAVGAIAGDNAGYWLGHHGGSRLVRRYGHRVRLDARKLTVGRYLFARHGRKIVFFGRLITALRTYAAFFAGLNEMRRSRFLVVNAAASVMWATACSLGAYALGSAATRMGTALMIGGLAAAGLLTIVVALVMNQTVRRLEARAAAAFPDPPRIDPANPRRSGSSARRLVPPPGGLSRESRPPIASTRSFRPTRPVPRVKSAPPAPSSRTARRKKAAPASAVTVTAEARACLAALVSASATK